MSRIFSALLATALCIPFAAVSGAQNTAESEANATLPPVYKLVFTVRELSAGKVETSHAYEAIYQPSKDIGDNEIHSGDRIPLPTNNDGTQYQYIDDGVAINFRPPSSSTNQKPSPDELPIIVRAKVSGIADAKSNTASRAPMIRTNEWSSLFRVKLNKPTLIFSADDPSIDRTTQVELTATKLP